MTIIAASLYGNPLHSGHINYLTAAKYLNHTIGKDPFIPTDIDSATCLNKLIVIVNNDAQVKLKRSQPFMDEYERACIIKALRVVDDVIIAVDQDDSVAETLKIIKPDFFVNGGDATPKPIEVEACKNIGCEMVFNVGGPKTQSSSQLLNNILPI